MPLVRILKKTFGLIGYVTSGDSLDGDADDGTNAPGQLKRARTWLRWMTAGEHLPEEDPPAGARPATKGAWFLKADPFPTDLPVAEKTQGFWSWVLRRDPDSK